MRWTLPRFDKPRLKFDNVALEGIIPTVLDRFAAMPYNELLDYVYFETAPMKDAVKGQPLDFGGIPKSQRFVDPVSLLLPGTFQQLRKKLEKLEFDEMSAPECEELVDPNVLELLVTIDGEGLFTLPENEVHIDADFKEDLKALTED
ncbi:MAG: hypothetical protein FVQ85_20330 [Planctomycetes bacterium]|nr:hypothetical protein [Planctomycetota bacterium]